MSNVRLMLLAETDSNSDLERIFDAYEEARRRRDEERRRREERSAKLAGDGDEEATERSKRADGSTCASGRNLASLIGDEI